MICAAGRLRTRTDVFGDRHSPEGDEDRYATVGAGALVLKRAADAQRDGDQILAILGDAPADEDSPDRGFAALLGLGSVLRTTLTLAGAC